MTDNRTFRNAGRPVVIECPSVDYNAGVRSDVIVRVRVSSIEMKHAKTKRWKTVWSAHEEGRLGSHIGNSPRDAIVRALCMNPKKRPKWLAEVVKQVTA